MSVVTCQLLQTPDTIHWKVHFTFLVKDWPAYRQGVAIKKPIFAAQQ